MAWEASVPPRGPWVAQAQECLLINGDERATNGRASPTTTAWLISGCARIRSSSGAGATFFPAAVTINSFFRPVIRR